jgi:NTP pyrophosphatase (non-canonical NTP hydrolase)
MSTGAPAELDDWKQLAIRQEMADVLIYLIRLADKPDVDLVSVVEKKLEHNRVKYPADKVRGSARKYADY